MASLTPLADYSDFRAAADQARSIATEYVCTVNLARSSSGWTVLLPPSVLKKITAAMASITTEEDIHDEVSTVDWVGDDGGYDGDKDDDDILSELQDDQDNYARSEEDGWFYDE